MDKSMDANKMRRRNQ